VRKLSEISEIKTENHNSKENETSKINEEFLANCHWKSPAVCSKKQDYFLFELM
jgi:hypothetical protein